jgi:hypothetical protein
MYGAGDCQATCRRLVVVFYPITVRTAYVRVNTGNMLNPRPDPAKRKVVRDDILLGYWNDLVMLLTRCHA